MTTIIIVIVGIAMLTLGLVFVTKIFKGLDEALPPIKPPINILGPKVTGISFEKVSIELGQGNKEVTNIILTNADSKDYKFYFTINSYKSNPMDASKWFDYRLTKLSPKLIKSGQQITVPFVVSVPNGAKTGDYVIDAEVNCNGCSGDKKLDTLTIKVKS